MNAPDAAESHGKPGLFKQYPRWTAHPMSTPCTRDGSQSIVWPGSRHPERSTVVRDFFRHLLPDGCLACSAARIGALPLCAACRRDLVPVPAGECQDAIASWPDVSHLYAAWFMEPGGAARSVIHGLKYSGLPWIGDVVGRLLATLVDRSPDLIVPVPLGRAKWRERGYNQAEALAGGVSLGLGGIPMGRVLERPRASVSQTLKGRAGRTGRVGTAERSKSTGGVEPTRRVRRAFVVAPGADLNGLRILLIDDVFTTGATAAAAARSLLEAGAASVDVAVAGLTTARRGLSRPESVPPDGRPRPDRVRLSGSP